MAVINSNRMDLQGAVSAIREEIKLMYFDVLEETVNEVAAEAAKKLKAESPKKSGQYAKNWKVKKSSSSRAIWNVGAIVYGGNPTYRLSHLLEHGHANRDGGRTQGIEHIKPVERWATEETLDRFYAKVERLTR